VYEGKLVALAAMQRAYIDLLIPWVNNLEATAGVMIEPPIVLETETAWYENLKSEHRQKVFAILIRENEHSEWRYVGHTGLHRITWPEGYAVSGSFIGDTQTHAKGYGTEAKLFLLHHAFYVLGLRKVLSEAKAFNGNSIGHLLKTGYRIIGRRKEHHFHNGTYVDDVLLEVFKRDFDPIWDAYKTKGLLPSLTKNQRKELQKIVR
jgi:RimJ/RimL family protein N-acetyltransferase